MPLYCFPQRLHEGVLRDLERMERKKDNLRVLEEQITLTKELEAERDRRAAALQSPDQPHA